MSICLSRISVLLIPSKCVGLVEWGQLLMELKARQATMLMWMGIICPVVLVS